MITNVTTTTMTKIMTITTIIYYVYLHSRGWGEGAEVDQLVF
jgi:hypothetical protein